MKTEDTSRARTARRYGFLLLSWSLLVSGSLVWNMHQETRNTLGAATAAANANIDKDFAFRKWATSHGGVYVPPTEHTPPNPYLNLPDRDVVTSKRQSADPDEPGLHTARTADGLRRRVRDHGAYHQPEAAQSEERPRRMGGRGVARL